MRDRRDRCSVKPAAEKGPQACRYDFAQHWKTDEIFSSFGVFFRLRSEFLPWLFDSSLASAGFFSESLFCGSSAVLGQRGWWWWWRRRRWLEVLESAAEVWWGAAERQGRRDEVAEVGNPACLHLAVLTLQKDNRETPHCQCPEPHGCSIPRTALETVLTRTRNRQG